jgi:hypothetical protein
MTVVPPETVAEIGGGSVDHGHEVLDEFVKHVRNEHIAQLKKPPVSAGTFPAGRNDIRSRR